MKTQGGGWTLIADENQYAKAVQFKHFFYFKWIVLRKDWQFQLMIEDYNTLKFCLRQRMIGIWITIMDLKIIGILMVLILGLIVLDSEVNFTFFF